MSATLLIAGGGTGGHVFPGIAVAQCWQKHGGQVIFVGTTSGQEKNLVSQHGFALRFLKVGRLKGTGLGRKILTLAKLPIALVNALRLLHETKPHVVLGIGGYASGPACVAAMVKGIKTAILDQNVWPGLTNRWLGKIVDRVFISFAKTREFFPGRKVVLTGNPIRSGIKPSPYIPHQEKMVLFVFGGSQGAVTMNKAITEALALLPGLHNKLEIYHQAGATDEDDLKSFYQRTGIKAVVQRFFDNMNELYAQSHLVICRAGAGTVTELALSGRPAILVPYPFAADNHQKKNADYFVEFDAAWLMEQKDLQADGLAKLLKDLYDNPQKLADKAQKMCGLGVADAASRIVNELLAMTHV